MYDELVKRLRNRRICIQQSGSLDDFPLLKQAADAIEELQQIAGHYEEAAHDYFKDVCYYLERMPKWIPVTERLPEQGDPLSICLIVGGEYDQLSWYELCDFADGRFWTMESESECHVTHWMPLPQPPKEE